MNRRWFKVAEIAAYLSLSPKTVYDLCSRGLLPFVKFKGIGLRIDKPKLDAMLEAEEITPIQEQLAGRE